jgi:hypothetical protein
MEQERRKKNRREKKKKEIRKGERVREFSEEQ